MLLNTHSLHAHTRPNPHALEWLSRSAGNHFIFRDKQDLVSF